MSVAARMARHVASCTMVPGLVLPPDMEMQHGGPPAQSVRTECTCPCSAVQTWLGSVLLEHGAADAWPLDLGVASRAVRQRPLGSNRICPAMPGVNITTCSDGAFAEPHFSMATWCIFLSGVGLALTLAMWSRMLKEELRSTACRAGGQLALVPRVLAHRRANQFKKRALE